MIEESNARQFFETEIGVPGGSLTARFVAVPERSVDSSRLLSQPKDLLEKLQLRLLKPLPTDLGSQVSQTAPAGFPEVSEEIHQSVHLGLVSILDQPSASDAVNLMERLIQAAPAEKQWLASAEVIAFAEEMTILPMVPFENSPLGLESLLGIVAKGSGPGIGAAAAIVAFGATPLLLIAVPAGMVIGGAALGVGQALQLGLRNRLLRLMGVEPSEATEVT